MSDCRTWTTSRASDQLSVTETKQVDPGQPLTIAGKQYEHRARRTCRSEVIYAVKPGYERFVPWPDWMTRS
jgi:hypothetical protein